MLVQACEEADFDASTGVCASPYYAELGPLGMPPLSVSEGQEIAYSIGGLWALVWCVRQIIRLL